MDLNHIIGYCMKIFSFPKLLCYKLFGLNISLFSGAIFFGFPKLRHMQLIKIGQNFQLWRFSRLSWNIEVGNNVFINEFWSINASVSEEGKIIFKDNIMCGPWVFMQSWDHAFRKGEIYMKAEWWKSDSIIIGNNVWIGARSIILKGVEIWDNSVIGAGSVVTKSIPSGVLAVGNPAKVIRTI